MCMELPKDIKIKMQTLLDAGFDAFIIGGWNRDNIRNKEPHDIDIFSNATGKQILKLFPKGVVIGNDERQKKILTVIVDGVEISQYRANGDRTKVGTSLDDHLNTCDFTVNSIASDINGNYYDPNNGIGDVSEHIINCVGNPEDRFNEDPLRILRAIRFKCTTGFDIDEHTEDILRDKIKSKILLTIPQERVKDEFMKMIKYKKCFEILFSNFILDLYLPECIKCHTLNGGGFHDEYVLAHMDFTFKEAFKLTDDYRIYIACFLHDIGKATTYKNENGKISFLGHQKESAKITERFLRKLKFSNADIKYITTMVAMHMMGDVDALKNNTIIKYANELEDAGISVEDMLIMTYCDNQGNQAKPRITFNSFYKNNNWLRVVYKLKYQRMPFRICDLEIDGKDCMALGLKGKEIGIKLNEIFDLVVDGELTNDRHILLRYLKGNYISEKDYIKYFNKQILDSFKLVYDDKFNIIGELK